MKCPLCGSIKTSLFFTDKRRSYHQCHECKLVFVPENQRLTRIDEKAEYDKHENDSADQGYRKFLSRLSKPVNDYISEKSYGLDFGCGPGPTLSIMLREYGHTVDEYDIFYNDNQYVFNNKYDFITTSEVVEHLFNPKDVFAQLHDILKPSGILGIMTKRVLNVEGFANWHYKNDMTHVCFFSVKTFEWIANEYNCKLNIISNDVVILQKL